MISDALTIASAIPNKSTRVGRRRGKAEENCLIFSRLKRLESLLGIQTLDGGSYSALGLQTLILAKS